MSLEYYRRGMRACIRGFWKKHFTPAQFETCMRDTIRRHLTEAWYSGAKLCGILPSELTIEEHYALDEALEYEYQWIPGFSDAIRGSEKLSPMYERAEIWIGRWTGVRDQARVMACADQKLEWVQGPTSDQCGSCTKLAGKVKRGSYWYEKGILPRVHDAWYLDCKGFR